MLLQGWDKASTLAGANVDREQATRLANAGFEQQAAITNAQLATQAELTEGQLGMQGGIAGLNAQVAMADQANRVALANAAAQNQMGMNYQNLSYQGAQADADRFLRALAQQAATDQGAFGATVSGIGALNQLGTQQQQTNQRALDYYWQQLTQLQNLLKLVNPGMNTQGVKTGSTTGTSVGTGTQTQTTTRPTDWSSILLGGLGLATKAAPLLGFSDRKDKTDIKKLGADPDTGIPMYAYRYKGDPKSYPKVVGPMADDLEKFLPGITKLIGGHQVVQLR